MKKQILGFLCGVVFTLGLVMIPAVADSVSKSINVLVDYVTVTLDGEEVDVSNFVHEGRTYLGLRDMGDLLGLQVDWDDKTQTAILTSPGKTPVWPSSGMQTIDVPIVKSTTMTVKGETIDPAWITETYNTYKKQYPSASDEDIKNAITQDAIWITFQDEMFEKYSISETEEMKSEAEASYLELADMYGGIESLELMVASNGFDVSEYKNDYIESFVENEMMIMLTENLEKDSEEIAALKAEKKAEFDKDKSLSEFPKATVKHILIPSGDGAEDEAKAVLARLKKGEKFETVLEEYKENDPGMPDEGYEVYLGAGFVTEFEEASVALTKGKFSDVVETLYGYHIIYCLEKSETIDFDEYFEMNFAEELNELLNNVYTSWVEQAEVDVTWGF